MASIVLRRLFRGATLDGFLCLAILTVYVAPFLGWEAFTAERFNGISLQARIGAILYFYLYAYLLLVIPINIIGFITGFAAESIVVAVGSGRGRLAGFGIAFSVAALLHGALWVLMFVRPPSTPPTALFYVFGLVVPTVVYIVVSAWVGKLTENEKLRYLSVVS